LVGRTSPHSLRSVPCHGRAYSEAEMVLPATLSTSSGYLRSAFALTVWPAGIGLHSPGPHIPAQPSQHKRFAPASSPASQLSFAPPCSSQVNRSVERYLKMCNSYCLHNMTMRNLDYCMQYMTPRKSSRTRRVKPPVVACEAVLSRPIGFAFGVTGPDGGAGRSRQEVHAQHQKHCPHTLHEGRRM